MKGTMGKIYCVPYNGDQNLIDELIPYSDYIHELYGSDSYILRSGNQKSLYNLEEVIKQLHQNNIEFNFIFNSSDYVRIVDELEEIEKYFIYLKEIRVDSLTISVPYLALKAKKLGFKVNTSTVQLIMTESKVEQLEKYGYDRFILADDITKRTLNIKSIRSITNKKIEFLINSGCLLDCAFKTFCYNVGSKNKDSVKNIISTISCFYHNQPFNLELFLKSSWIRSRDIPLYQSFGIDLFKIAGGDSPSHVIIEVLKTFIFQLETLPLFGSVYAEFLKDDDLNEFFHFFKEKGCGLATSCKQCRWCSIQANKLMEKCRSNERFVQ
jgi:collagenase-like PrtC family protease